MDQELAEKIAGEITLSENPGLTIRKWRDIFGISQQELARHINLSPSIISDYESGRRKSPGIGSIRRIVQALLEIDEERGGRVRKKFSPENNEKVIRDIREFPYGRKAEEFVRAIEGEVVAGKQFLNVELHGYTIIDSLKAIVTFNPEDYLKVYGWSTQRALLFTDVKYGRSPMVAIRAMQMKPSMVVYIQPEHVDELAEKLAEKEGISLVVTPLPLNNLIKRLRGF